MAATRQLVVLAKPPLPGHAKSRLAESIGTSRAARLARAMLRDTWEAVTDVAARRTDVEAVLARTGEASRYPLLIPPPGEMDQGPGDLGRRMASLGATALASAERVLLLGTDSPGLPPGHLEAALALLDEHDVVLGPTEDGGFWCLGMRADAAALRDPAWLDGLDWSADATAGPVRRRVAERGLTLAEAPAWFDVDRERDLSRLARELTAAPERAPATRRALAESPGPRLSVVVASLDEGEQLERCLDALRAQPGPPEIVVADGGSQDGSTVRAAMAPDVTVCVSPRGRGRQLAAGAALASCDALLFLHVDVRLPPDGCALVLDALSDGRAEAGAFVTRTEADPRVRNVAGPLLRLADMRSRVTRHPYGDQALFVTRQAYDTVGGFRDLPIMEDYDLSRRLADRRPLVRIRTPVVVSGRRMQARPLRSLMLMKLIPPLYRLGVDPDRLARLYRT